VVLVTSASAFTRARRTKDQCGDLDATREIAGVLAHEEWHLLHGPDEQGAYHAELIALIYLGAGPGTLLYQQVVRSMQVVIAASKRATQARVLMRPTLEGSNRPSAAPP
jgi:hypothetical protein